MPRVVIDANVFISGLLTDGTPRRLIDQLKLDNYELFYPPRLMAEPYQTQTREKLASRIKPERLIMLIDLIEDNGTMIDVTDAPGVSRDPKDNDYVECAVISGSEIIITGDDDLLSLGQHRGVKVITPREFLDLLSDTE